MGWTYSNSWKSKTELVNYLNSPAQLGSNLRIIASAVVGNCHWYVGENATTGHRFVGLDLMGKDRDEWGYKSMDESVSPYYYTCPLKFLDMAQPEPDPSQTYAAEWRAKVRAHHAARQQKKSDPLRAGMLVKYGKYEYQLIQPAGPRKGWHVVGTHNKVHYRMTAQQLNKAERLGA